MGDTDTHTFGPIDAAEGQRVIALIAKCPAPSDKFCSCAADEALVHPRLFG